MNRTLMTALAAALPLLASSPALADEALAMGKG